MDVFGYARHWMMHSSHAKRPYLQVPLPLARSLSHQPPAG